MPKHKPKIQLTDDIRQRIEAELAEPSTPPERALRLRIVLLASQKKSIREIMKTLAISLTNVCKWMGEFRTGGLDALNDKRNGPKTELLDDIRQRIEAELAEPSTPPPRALRLRMILLAAQGMSLGKIAKTLATPKPNVNRWLSKFRAGGFDALKSRLFGSKVKLSEDIKRRIEAELANPSTHPEKVLRLRMILLASQKMNARDIATELSTPRGTVHRWLHAYHMGGLDALNARLPRLKFNIPADIKQRIEAELAAPSTQRERATRLRMVLLASQQVDVSVIAKKLSTARSNVVRWLDAFRTGGLDALNEKRRGPKIEISEDIKRRIEAELADPSTHPEKALRLRVVLLAAQKMNDLKIAKTLSTYREKVVKWLNRFKEGGLDALRTKRSELKIELSEDIKQRIEAELADSATPRARATRLRIVLLASQGMYDTKIAKTLKISRETVHLWMHDFHKGGFAALNGRLHGKRLELSEDITQRIEAELADPATPPDRAKRLRIVLFSSQKMNNSKIAKALAISRPTVNDWLNAFRTGGLDALNGKQQDKCPKIKSGTKKVKSDKDNVYCCESVDIPLFKACEQLDLEGVKKAVANGANVNALEKDGVSAMTTCCMAIMEMFYRETGEESPHYELEKTTPENTAIIEKYTEVAYGIISFLLEKGADIDLCSGTDATPLYQSYYFPNSKLMRFLLEHGANPNINCFYADSMEEWYIASSALNRVWDEQVCLGESRRLIEMERLLLEYGARLYKDRFVLEKEYLWTSTREEEPPPPSILIQRIANFSESDKRLYTACAKVRVHSILDTLSAGANINLRDDEGRNLLAVAIEFGSQIGAVTHKAYYEGKRAKLPLYRDSDHYFEEELLTVVICLFGQKIQLTAEEIAHAVNLARQHGYTSVAAWLVEKQAHACVAPLAEQSTAGLRACP